MVKLTYLSIDSQYNPIVANNQHDGLIESITLHHVYISLTLVDEELDLEYFENLPF